MNCAARLWRKKSASSSAAWGRAERLCNCWLCVASIGIHSHSSAAASQLWCGSTCGHPSTTGFREKPTDCPDSIRLATATVVEAGEGFLLDGGPLVDRLPRKYSLKCPEMLGLRARREIGSSRLPDAAKGQTTPVPARDRLCRPHPHDFLLVTTMSPHPE